MTRSALVGLVGVAAVGAALLMRDAAARSALADDASTGETALDYVNPFGAIERLYEDHQTATAMQTDNLPAFLAMIRMAEGTSRAADPYRVCFAYRHTIVDLVDHPAITGEWRGERLTDAQCIAAGFSPGCVSTAAGAYQMTKPTWREAKRALGLVDFGPESQDRAAVYLIRRRGAIDAIAEGRITDAIHLCRQEWASLPGAGYGQPERQLASLLGAFEAAGGWVA